MNTINEVADKIIQEFYAQGFSPEDIADVLTTILEERGDVVSV